MNLFTAPRTRRTMICRCLSYVCAASNVHAQPVIQSVQRRSVIAANACGVNPDNSTTMPTRVSSSGSASFDTGIRLERPMLDKYFQVEPEFYFVNDVEGPLAKAYNGEDKVTVVVGVNFVKQEKALNPQYWEIAMIGILAHEWAHAFQYSTNLREMFYTWETHADFLAGWYLGSKHSSGMNRLDPDVFGASLYVKGNQSGFFDPAAYGAPAVRVAAMKKGFEFAYKESRAGEPHDVRAAAAVGYRYIQGLPP